MIHIDPLSPEQLRALKRFARREVGRVAERAFMVLLASRGLSAPQIADLLAEHPETVRHWLQRYRTEGLEGLRDRPRSGRPPKAGADARATLRRTLAESPTEQGYPHTVWTVPLLARHLHRVVGLVLSASTLRRLLHALGYVWRRAKLGPAPVHDPDTAARLAAIEAVQAEAARPDAALHMCYEDETHVQLLPLVRAMWRPRGRPQPIPTPGTNRKFSIFGALDAVTGAWHYRMCERACGDEFVAFLEHLCDAYPTGRIVLVLDNAGIHFCRCVQAWLEGHPRVALLPLPRYSPHLNPVEHVWKVLKDAVAANRACTDLEALQQRVQHFFAQFQHPPLVRRVAA